MVEEDGDQDRPERAGGSDSWVGHSGVAGGREGEAHREDELGEDDEEDREEEDEEDEEDGDEDDLLGWEPPPANLPDKFPALMDEDIFDTHGLDQDAHQRVELQVSTKTIVECFPSTDAGKVHLDHGEGPNGSRNAYAASVGITEKEPYAPFKSKIDWEVARWAKLRGPRATAITDLLKIETVSAGAAVEMNHVLTNQ